MMEGGGEGTFRDTARPYSSTQCLQDTTPILSSPGNKSYSTSDFDISGNSKCHFWKSFEQEQMNETKYAEDVSPTAESSGINREAGNLDECVIDTTTLDVSEEVSDGDSIIRNQIRIQSSVSPCNLELKESFFTVLSGLYGIFLSVIGIVVPIVETFQFGEESYAFMVFYVYIYLCSILFLLYVYLFLLHNQSFGKLKRRLTRSKVRRLKDSDQSPDPKDDGTTLTKSKRHKIVFKPHSEHHTGSFYLRLGAVGFGIGSMLLEGLYFLEYFEPGGEHVSCSDGVYTLRPLFNLIFTFCQLYFVFLNSQMRIVKHRVVAKFGLIHMAATNICIWCRTIVVETMNYINEVKEIIIEDHMVNTVSYSTSHHDTTAPSTNHSFEMEKEIPSSVSCEWSELIGSILQEATPYLYPFKIEFSFICAGILFVMWRNIYEKHRAGQEPRDVDIGGATDKRRYHRISVDCAGSSRGLFLGILMFVAVVLCIIAFFNVMSNDLKNKTAVILSYTMELFLYNIALICTLLAARRMRHLKFTITSGDILEEAMILISLTGLYVFATFSIIAGMFHINTLDGILTVATNLSMIVQASVQTIFMMASMRMSAKNTDQVHQKPGRELVTFLLLNNFTMWVVNSFETQKPQHDPIQLEIYGPKAWAILVHISFPLAIFYRFHSTVCISHVWKQAWKMRGITNGIEQ